MNPYQASPVSGGLLALDKPSGPTTYDLIRWIKPATGSLKVGHCGTLDPLASGLVIVLIGSATRLQSNLMGMDKRYTARIRFGVRTDTGDVRGRVVEQRPEAPPGPTQIAKAIAAFPRDVYQTPPMYAAIKHEGTPLYKLARQGKTVERKARLVTIHKFELLNADKPGECDVRCHVSSGTYIRTLVEDLAASIGCLATTMAIRRETIGAFDVTNSLYAEDAAAMTREELLAACQAPSENAAA